VVLHINFPLGNLFCTCVISNYICELNTNDWTKIGTTEVSGSHLYLQYIDVVTHVGCKNVIGGEL